MVERPAPIDWGKVLGEDLILSKAVVKDNAKAAQGSVTHVDDKLCSISTAQVLPNTLKLVLLYFSGRWCPICAEFDNVLRDVCASLKSLPERADMEFVWVSCDLSEDAFKAHLRRLGPMFASRWSPKRLQEVTARWELKAIPALVVLDAQDGRLVTFGRGDMEEAYDSEQHGGNKGYVGLVWRWLELLDEQRAALDDLHLLDEAKNSEGSTSQRNSRASDCLGPLEP